MDTHDFPSTLRLNVAASELAEEIYKSRQGAYRLPVRAWHELDMHVRRGLLEVATRTLQALAPDTQGPLALPAAGPRQMSVRSEERRVGKECRL